jgi:anthranilate phosphoribosyltransferase
MVLGELGGKAALVVHGADGLDELSTTGVNRISRLQNGSVETFALDPAELGFPAATLDDLAGGTPEENARITRQILAGADQGPRRDIVLLNAAAAIYLESNDWPSSLDSARRSIDSGAALETLDAWIARTRSFASG